MEEKIREGGAPATNASTTTSSITASTKTPEVVAVEQAPRRRAGAPKRKANSLNTSGLSSTPSKRLAKEKLFVPLPPIHNGPCTRARQTPNKLAAAAAAAAASAATTAIPEKLTEDVPLAPSSAAGEVVAPAEESNAPNESWQALEPLLDAELEAVKSRDANAHVIPTHAAWFSWNKIHPLEERAMASFFNGKSEKRTPDIYMEIRNWIMKKFHTDPKTHVELKDLSDLSVGELDARQEVLEFLDHWGLINFHPFPPTDSVMANAEADGAVKTASLIEKLYRFETVQFCPPVGPRTDLSTPSMPPRFFPESAIADDLVTPEGPAVEYHCNSCSADCSRKRYHCQKQADFDLCPDCYNNGKFDSGMSTADFILMEPAEAPGVSGGSWTDQETLLLLEALELYGENWNEIAEHVATKTKAQCILHFVQMPIEDTFLEGKDELDASVQGNNDPGLTNNDSSALKDDHEATESKSAANEEQPISSPVDTLKPKDEENKDIANEDKPFSSSAYVPKPKDASDVKVSVEASANCAINALKEAFQAVGSVLGPEGSLSFAEAGNPVMALVAFLAGLVEPDVAVASARGSLKAISEESPGIQMATRHCFLLEDPIEDKKEPPVPECTPTETVDVEAQKDQNQKEEQQIKENSMPAQEGVDASKECINKKIEDAVPKEENVVSSGTSARKSLAANESGDGGTQEVVAPTTQEEVTSSAKEVEPCTEGEEGLEPSNAKESSDLTLPGQDVSNTVTGSDHKALPTEVSPNLVNESGGAVSEGITQGKEVGKVAEMELDSVTAEEKEPQQPVSNNSMVETGAKTEVVEGQAEKNSNLAESKDDHNIDKIKRAAITALSAAVVKAKILANQEEDQIRQLAMLLVEKQVREQMDRSRQRLYHERAQIIAARLGLPASSSRPIPPSLPNNKIAMGYANSMPRPLPSMTSSKPPIRRTMVTSAPLLSGSSVPSTVTGNLRSPPNQDKVSSVGTN
ncbi:PREDICTED: SWI/SNF complex subunit SWI3D isoform X2 [Nelumbo nucifera]|uniref:SWI/SNF complex subunit SWI3D isoform X2 n=2 Tax=Nelumbo nucifera TaxID=4432 RepID=A0A1U8A029_NELNU|nr:PREDICTED: SWI/SNF complex subunit SWI3D isoform X2 [Nelumbo nucifera]DAD40693.1 TPA_asm: hypothetical protein HUJ06_015016 [Nelumbo nucifera]